MEVGPFVVGHRRQAEVRAQQRLNRLIERGGATSMRDDTIGLDDSVDCGNPWYGTHDAAFLAASNSAQACWQTFAHGAFG